MAWCDSGSRQREVARQIDFDRALADGDGRKNVEKRSRICAEDCAVLCANPWRMRSPPERSKCRTFAFGHSSDGANGERSAKDAQIWLLT